MLPEFTTTDMTNLMKAMQISTINKWEHLNDTIKIIYKKESLKSHEIAREVFEKFRRMNFKNVSLPDEAENLPIKDFANQLISNNSTKDFHSHTIYINYPDV